MQWQEVCNHPDLQNLPFKIELNERGQIVMSPVKVYHSAYQGEIGHWLRTLLNAGKTLPECAIKTRKGTKVADMAGCLGRDSKRLSKKPNVRSRRKFALRSYRLQIRLKKSARSGRSILNAARKKSGPARNRAKCVFLIAPDN